MLFSCTFCCTLEIFCVGLYELYLGTEYKQCGRRGDNFSLQPRSKELPMEQCIMGKLRARCGEMWTDHSYNIR